VAPLLDVSGMSAGYDGHPFVHDINLYVEAGEVVTLLGANGAGKTTTLLALSGDLTPLAGSVEFNGAKKKMPLYRMAQRGLAFVTEERSVFMRLSVAENLRVGNCDIDRVLTLFPELDPLLDRRAGNLSGGEQQMLTLGRALARPTKLLLIDELSLGLAPQIVARLLQAVRQAADDGLGVLIVEQHVEAALRHADRAYVLQRGRIVLEGPCSEIAGKVRDLEESYLASSGGHALASAGAANSAAPDQARGPGAI